MNLSSLPKKKMGKSQIYQKTNGALLHLSMNVQYALNATILGQ
jgi:hypothetical protein